MRRIVSAVSFNLLTAPWLEVRRGSRRDVVRPCDIAASHDPILALDFPRPDWNAAVTEFLIGLCALTMTPADEYDWAEGFVSPPTPEAWQARLAPFVAAFDFDGEGPRAFQDWEPLAGLKSKSISGLLIDAPGDNTLEKNADLFIKRDGAAALGLPYAAAALITLQTYAPTGGAGHRTSLRGGGPLTTLVAPRRKGCSQATLWDTVWANLPERGENWDDPQPEQVFPWLSPTRTSAHDELVTPDGHHPLLAFFACPRRIRLDFADSVACGLSGVVGRAAVALRTQNYGACYQHWRHPLSPYRQDKKSGLLPVHPHAGPSDYGDWLAWWGFSGQPAAGPRLWSARRDQVAALLDPFDGVEAFGFDMDNMKARQWLSARLPWIPLTASAEPLKEEVAAFIAAADAAARGLTRAVILALYGIYRARDDTYRQPDPAPALPEIGERLWRDTEPGFRRHLEQLRQRLGAGSADVADLKQDWLRELRRRALTLFDHSVDMDGLTHVQPRRLLWARNGLSFEFADHPKASVRKALGLAASVKPARSPADGPSRQPLPVA